MHHDLLLQRLDQWEEEDNKQRLSEEDHHTIVRGTWSQGNLQLPHGAPISRRLAPRYDRDPKTSKRVSYLNSNLYQLIS